MKLKAVYKLSEQYCALDLTICLFGAFRYLVHYCLLVVYVCRYAKHIYCMIKRIYWSQVLGAGSFMFGAVCGTRGLIPQCRFALAPDILPPLWRAEHTGYDKLLLQLKWSN